MASRRLPIPIIAFGRSVGAKSRTSDEISPGAFRFYGDFTIKPEDCQIKLRRLTILILGRDARFPRNDTHLRPEVKLRFRAEVKIRTASEMQIHTTPLRSR